MSHRAEAKRLLEAASSPTNSNEVALLLRVGTACIAQTHATLAVLEALDEMNHQLQELRRNSIG